MADTRIVVPPVPLSSGAVATPVATRPRVAIPPAPPPTRTGGTPVFPAAPPPPKPPVDTSNWISVGELLAQTRAATLAANATKAEPEQATVAGENSLIRVVYGRRRLGAQITLVVFDTAGAMLLRCVWCKGPIDAIEELQIGDAPPPAGVTWTNYTGASGQGVDGNIVSALSHQGKTYTDALPGVAYSVVKIPANWGDGFPQITAKVRGLKVRRVAQEAIAFNGSSMYGQVAHGAQNAINDDFEIVVGAKATDWTPAAEQNLFSKWNATGNQRVFRFVLLATGALRLEVSTDGTAVIGYSSSATIGAANGSLLWVRARFQKTDGANSRVRFATSLDGMTWTALGTEQTGASVANLFAGTEPLRLAALGGPTGYFAGSIVAATMTSAANVVCDMVAFEAPENVATWTDASGALWSLTNTASPNTRAWSQDPIDCLCDFIASPTYGANARVGIGGAIYANAITAMQVGSPAEAYAQLDLTLEQATTVDEWIDVLRDYAYCFVVPEGDAYLIVRDWDDPATFAFTESNIVANTLTFQKRAAAESPTVVQVAYTDVTGARWRDYQAPAAYANGVLTGAVPRRMSQVAKPGITRFSEANRYTIQRLNKALLGDLTIVFRAFDEAAAVRKGDIVTVTHSIGFDAKPFRVLDIAAAEPGRWQITAQEHDPLMYSTTVAAGPSTVDTVLPSPQAPPLVEQIQWQPEEIYQLQTGRWASRLRATWADAGAPDGDRAGYPFVDRYVVTILRDSGTVAVEGPTLVPSSALAYVTGPLEEGIAYRARVQIQTSIGVIGLAAESADYVTHGKDFVPGPVQAITAFEVGGEVRLSWVPGVDMDITATELRYGTTSATWDSGAALLDRVPSPTVRYSTKVIPAGQWRIFAKMLDSVRSVAKPFGQESTDAATCDVTVTTDAAAFVAGAHAFTTPILSHMSASGSGWVTDFGDLWSALFTLTMSNYTKPIAAYHTAGMSGLVTETFDFGSLLAGDFYVGMTAQNVDSGGAAPVQYIEICKDGPEGSKSISGATAATPIVITCTGHGYTSGDEVQITGVGGVTQANGLRTVTVIDANSYSLQDLFGTNITGTGGYTSGGTSQRWIWKRYQATTVKETARYVRARITSSGSMFVASLGEARCNVVARSEGGTVATSGVSGTPTIVTFVNRYNKAVSALATANVPVGSPALYCAVDNVEVDGARGVGVGQALFFDGVDDYVRINDSVALSPTSAFTVEMLLNPLYLGGGGNYWMAPVGKWNWNGGNPAGAATSWVVQVNKTTGQVFFNIATSTTDVSGNNYVFCGSGAVVQNRWSRVSCVFDGSLTGNLDRAKIYIDGILVSNNSVGTIPATIPDSTAPIDVGHFQNFNEPATNGRSWIGRIDDMRMWNVARTAAAIAGDMNTMLNGNESGLVGYWKFDSLSGTTATDSTSNANHGAVSGAKWRPLNGMDLYTFDASGAQAACTAGVSWNFSGV